VKRRTVLAAASALSASVAGCGRPSETESTPTNVPRTDSEPATRLAHTVTVYLGEGDETHDVSAVVRDAEGTVLFDRAYSLSDDNEADEDATFSASGDPETVVVTVDGTEFERDWPGFEHPELPCRGENRTGIELWIEDGADGSPSVRLEANCQYSTV
jgi:hypothetical protein